MNEEYILLEEIDISNEMLKFIDKVYEEKVGEEDGNIETDSK